MADRTITVRRVTTPTRTFILTNADLGSENDPEGAVDITNYVFKLLVKYDSTPGEFTDAQAAVDATGAIVTAASGIFKFDLSVHHTNLPPGTWPGEIRFWTSSPASGEPPDGVLTVDYVVEEAIDSVV
jgi:hypothetical protein